MAISNRIDQAQRDMVSMGAALNRVVREHPLLATAGAGLLGAMLGGLAFSRFARLLFVGAGGFVANELRRSGGRVDVDAFVAWLASDDSRSAVVH